MKCVACHGELHPTCGNRTTEGTMCTSCVLQITAFVEDQQALAVQRNRSNMERHQTTLQIANRMANTAASAGAIVGTLEAGMASSVMPIQVAAG